MLGCMGRDMSCSALSYGPDTRPREIIATSRGCRSPKTDTRMRCKRSFIREHSRKYEGLNSPLLHRRHISLSGVVEPRKRVEPLGHPGEGAESPKDRVERPRIRRGVAKPCVKLADCENMVVLLIRCWAGAGRTRSTKRVLMALIADAIKPGSHSSLVLLQPNA